MPSSFPVLTAHPFPRSPGDYLKPGEDEIDGLKRRLDDRLAPPTDSRQFNSSHGVDNEWEIGDCLAQWWRPNFETFMVCPYPIFLITGPGGGAIVALEIRINVPSASDASY